LLAKFDSFRITFIFTSHVGATSEHTWSLPIVVINV